MASLTIAAKTISLLLTLAVLLLASLHVSYLLAAFDRREEIMAAARKGSMDAYQVGSIDREGRILTFLLRTRRPQCGPRY